jgi:uncharacterized coiled-coil protein SlyX
MDKPGEHRIELEEVVAFQEKALAELNDALVDQSKTLVELVRRVEALEHVVRSMSQQLDLDRPSLPHEKPPHY